MIQGSEGQTYLIGINSNFVVSLHEIEEYSRYDQLAYHSSRVAVGQHVSADHAIARVVSDGGYAFMPHLHFQVFVPTGINFWSDSMTMEVKNFFGLKVFPKIKNL
jgi:murein DD-endopeptidase MepM/ murein hydrolase activator NlpD